MIGLDYKDSISLVDPVIDEYGSEKIGQVETVPALYIQRTGFVHAANQDDITSDGQIYIDPEHWFVVENVYRLEELLVIANSFNGSSSQAWYRIERVVVGQDKLLGNQIDNIKLELKKTTELNYVS
jgi:hypothetical protein